MNPLEKLQQKLIDLNCEKGASLWLSTLPIKEEGYIIAKKPLLGPHSAPLWLEPKTNSNRMRVWIQLHHGACVIM